MFITDTLIIRVLSAQFSSHQVLAQVPRLHAGVPLELDLHLRLRGVRQQHAHRRRLEHHLENEALLCYLQLKK